MKRYRFVEKEASKIVFEAMGHDARELFTNAAEALFSVICKLDEVGHSVERTVEADAQNIEDLLINWLHALIAASDMEDIFFSKFEIIDITDTHLRAICSGEPLSDEKKNVAIKVASYQDYMFDDGNKGFRCRVTIEL